MSYTYHQDPSHGWVEVPMAELRALGIASPDTSVPGPTGMAKPPT